MKSFFQLLLLVDFVFLGAIFFLRELPLVNQHTEFLILSVLFLTAITAIAYTFIYRGLMTGDNKQFFNKFGIGMGIKFFSSLLFVVLYYFTRGVEDDNVIIPFFMAYFAFNVVMIVSAFRTLKPAETGNSAD